ncbi:MAG TPA: hypothetical protein PKW55_03535 [Spirochaetota bacterium]|nr:hypothetical protein [Spirochaetota bacterium]HOM38092.1 hypothetical protein [Spirochaetota bacterium]HPQ48894.1 hypothetical protein [Spirochaetota bacterium]
MGKIYYKGKSYTQLILSLSSKNSVRDLLGLLLSIKTPLKYPYDVQWEFVVMELLTNSIIASIKNNVDNPIILFLDVDKTFFTTIVSDGAGGFDFKTLPYDIFAKDISNIDVFDKLFEEYRAREGYARFGLGLYAAKKFADYFDIFLIDKKGNKTISFSEGMINGTKVIIRKRIK